MFEGRCLVVAFVDQSRFSGGSSDCFIGVDRHGKCGSEGDAVGEGEKREGGGCRGGGGGGTEAEGALNERIRFRSVVN